MKKTFFLKLFVSFFFITLLYTSLFIMLTFPLIKKHYINALTDELKELAVVLQPQILPLIKDNRTVEIDEVVKKHRRNIETRITIINPDGTVLGDSDEEPKTMGSHSDRHEIILALNGESGTSIRFSETLEKDMLYVAIPISEGGPVLGVVRVSVFLSDIDILIGKLQKRILFVVMGIILLSLGGALLFSHALSKPIREIEKTAQKVADGNFKARVFLKQRDELGRLAHSFNFMAERIDTLFSELTHQKDELSRIISSIEDGLIVLDRDGKIMLTNESFQKIAGVQSPLEAYYWEVIRQPMLDELIKEAHTEKGSTHREIAFNEKIFHVGAAYVPSKDEIILTFHDITEIKNLETVKREFVTNVSHELKTPLTAIKGFLETMENVSDEKNAHYLEIIVRNTERLIGIVGDISHLSELEERGNLPSLERVNINRIILDVIAIFETQIGEKGLTLTTDLEDKKTAIMADPFQLEQIIINLIDNAVKYTNEGEINITAKTDDHWFTLSVTDTGIGIPEEDLPRIFERFYRADKSRSRRLGGTGLGLSIVKYIVLLHNGSINVESTLGSGSTFTIKLPNEKK